jgi:hypothetical protein
VGGHRQEADDPVSGFDIGDTFANCVDGACDVDAGGMGQDNRERSLQVATADTGVDAIERRRGNADPNLARIRSRLLDLLVAEHIRPAELVEAHCLHFRNLVSM